VIAVSGAEFDLTLDGRAVPMDAPFVASAESRLRFGARRRGARAYLAIAGGIATLPVLGSRSTHLISAMGGLDGRALRAGDRLAFGSDYKLPATRSAKTATTVGYCSAGVTSLHQPTLREERAVAAEAEVRRMAERMHAARARDEVQARGEEHGDQHIGA